MTVVNPPAAVSGRSKARAVFAVLQLLALVGLSLVIWPTSLGGRVSYVAVDGISMEPTYHLGDIAVVRSHDSYRVGDPVVYRIPDGEFGAGAHVIHRIVGGDGRRGFTTRGDNKPLDDPWHPRTGDVVGTVAFSVPHAGPWFAYLARPVNVGILCASITVACLMWPTGTDKPRRRRHVSAAEVES